MAREGKAERFFDRLCAEYYPKVLQYLFAALGDEQAARDCVQEVFLTAWQKRSLLAQHPNPGGFLFVTAKNLSRKTRREAFARLLRDSGGEEELGSVADPGAVLEAALDRRIDEGDYIREVLSRLDEDKRGLYAMHYLQGKTMAEIGGILQLEPAAVRMRFVRLRREIQRIAGELMDQCSIC